MMKKIVHNNYMRNLELQSLHYWFKNAPSQNPSIKYNNISKIMQNITHKTDISNVANINAQQFPNFTQASLVNFHDRVLLRNVFEHWKIYVIHKLHTRRATYKADYFYHKKLEKMVLNALSRNVLLKWKHIVSFTNKYTNESIISMNYEKAKTHYSKFLLRKYFKYWSCYILMIRKERALLLERAVTFYNVYCLKKYIINWKLYVLLQNRKKVTGNKINEARQFYARKILQRFMKIWIIWCEFPLQKSKMKNAIMHHRIKLLIKYVNAWKMYHEYKIEKLNVEERISIYNRMKLLKQYFKRFILRVNESIAERTMNENAEKFYNFKLIQKVFFAWQEWYKKKLQNAIKIYEIENIFENRRKSTIFNNWCLYVIQKKCKRRKLFIADNFYEKKLTVKTLKKIQDYAVYRKEKKIRLSYLNDKTKEITRQLQYIYIEKWRNALYSVVQEKQKMNQAIEFWKLNASRKYFSNWKEFSRQYKIKVARKQKLDEVATGFLLKKFVEHWHSKLQDVLDIRKKEFLAVSMAEHKILKKYFLLWERYIAQKVQMKNDIEAAMKLHKMCLLREGLKEIVRNSLYNIDYQRDFQLQNATMRSFQNYEILKEYFDKWHMLIYLKKKSKSICEITSNNKLPFTHVQTSSNNIFNHFKTRLVLPEYMLRKQAISNEYDSFDKFSQKHWSFD